MGVTWFVRHCSTISEFAIPGLCLRIIYVSTTRTGTVFATKTGSRVPKLTILGHWIHGLTELTNSEISRHGSVAERGLFWTPFGGVWEAPGRMGSGVPGPKGPQGTHPEIPSTIRSRYIRTPKYPVFQVSDLGVRGVWSLST